MKCICKYLLVFALGTSLASCSDFLDMTPDEVLTLDDVFNNLQITGAQLVVFEQSG